MFTLRVIGSLFILSPFCLYWFIHGNYDRYLWIINGPFPFSHFGSLPVQIILYVGLPIFGIFIILASFLIKKSGK